jgi:hypothetical protein
MPDIRTTGLIADFSVYPVENPLSGGGVWQSVASDRPPMRTLSRVDIGVHATRSCTGTGCLACYSGWNVESFDGDVEIWGYRVEAGYQIGHNERLALLTDINPATPWPKPGYFVLFHQSAGSHRYYLYRDSTLLANVAADQNLVLLRRSGNFVEVWDAPESDPSTWTRRIQVADTTYTTGLYLVIGEGDNHATSSVQSGWRSFGGGVAQERRQQIIRRPLG